MTPPDAPGAPSFAAALRRILDRPALTRLLIGWGAVLALALAAPALVGPLPGLALIALFGAVVAVIVIAAGGVVAQAEALAQRLGDPYGTLVLTLSIVVIEVILIAGVMLGPGQSATIARDSVMAVSMIIMNLVLGLCLLIGGLRQGQLALQRVGTSAYLVLLVLLGATAFALPAQIGEAGQFRSVQAVVVAALTMGLYALFLWRQMGAQAAEFQEVEFREAVDAPARPPLRTVLREHRAELLLRTGLLVATVLPIVLLAEHMAALVEDGLSRLGAPHALAGLLIAMIVFTPESLTAVRAVLGGEVQRVANLCHGALVSTYALTIPTVLLLGLVTAAPVVLAESGANLLLLGVTFALAAISAASPRVTAVHGAAHLMLFALYVLALFA